MGVLDNIFGPKHKVSKAPTTVSREPKYLEVNWGGETTSTKEYIRVLSLNEFSDVELVLDKLRDKNNIIVLKVKPRLVQEKLELKRALKRIQRTCQAIGGDIVGVKEDIIVIAPSSVSIIRPSESASTTPTEVTSETTSEAPSAA